jgi:hypothetical protein
MDFNFIASNNFDLNDFKNLLEFSENYPDFQTVVLSDENELKLLLELMKINEFPGYDLDNSEFSKYWDLSKFALPEFNQEQFEEFYTSWLLKSKRDNNMDEYGNLIFLQGLSTEWNKLRYRVVIK